MGITPTQHPLSSSPRRPSHDVLDPLSQGLPASTRNVTPTVSREPSRQPSQQPAVPSSQPRLAVVVNASLKRSHYHTPVVTYDEEDEASTVKKRAVISDLSPQFKKKMKAAKEAAKTAVAAPRAGRQASSAAKQLINNQYDKKKAFRGETSQLPQGSSASGTSTPTAPTRLGRPKGWKPGMSYAQMRGNPLPTKPKPGAGGLVKRRGRPPKAPSLPPREIFRMLKPQWLSFLCEWKDCNADLQNLSTLRRHVNAVHVEEQDYEEEGKVKDPWTCLWGSCGMAAQAPTFETYEEMEDHVEEKHMVPFGWHLGEGPQNDISERMPGKQEGEGDEVPSYLKDKHGNQITPSIKEQRIEDHAEMKERRKRLWHLMKTCDENSDSEDEEEHPEPVDEDTMMR